MNWSRHFLLRCAGLMLCIGGLNAGDAGSASVANADLARVADSGGNPDAAWNFAERGVRSGDPEEVRSGWEMLLNLSAERDKIDRRDFENRAREAGVLQERVNLWKAELALRDGDFVTAENLLDQELQSGKLSESDQIPALRLKLFAGLGLRKYAEAAASAAAWAEKESSVSGRFDARCYQIYAWSLAGDQEQTEQLFRETVKNYPEFSGALSDLRIFLDIQAGKWQDFLNGFEEREQHLSGQKSSRWYFAACRMGANHAEKLLRGGVPDAVPSEEERQKLESGVVRLRQRAMDCASSERERKLALLELCGTLERAQQWEKSSLAVQTYLEWYPESADRSALERRAGRCLFKAGLTDNAFALYDQILARDIQQGGGFETALEAARESAAVRNSERELHYLNEAIRHARTDQERQEGYFRKGCFFDRHEKFKEAVSAFRIVAEIVGPRQERGRFFLFQDLIRLQKYAEARKVAGKLQNAEDKTLRAGVAYHLASLYEKTGEPEKAVSAYRKFAGDFPESPSAVKALYNAALILESRGDIPEMRQCLEDFLKLAPKHELAPNVLFKLMEVQERSGMWEEAEKTALKLGEEFPDSVFAPAAFFRLADRALMENRCKDALDIFDRIGNFPGADSRVKNRVQYDRACTYVKLDDSRKAMTLLNGLLAGNSSDPVAADAAEMAGFLSAAAGDYTTAAERYARAAALRPGGNFANVCKERQADSLYADACVKESNELFSKAEAIYRELYGEYLKQNSGKYASPLYKMGLCLESQGELNLALERYEELLYTAAVRCSKGIAPEEPVWCSKALYSAVRISRGKRNLEGAKRAIALIEQVRSMGLGVEQELETVKQELKQKYKL